MPASKTVLAVVQEWIVKADNDLTAAAQILKLGKDTPTDTVCFHAQQCVEKYLKAILVYRNIPFKKTHEIRAVMALVPQRYRPVVDEAMQDRLTRYAGPKRYPESGPEISLTEARKAVSAARRVRREVRRKLPKAALPKKKK
jgi:HEPN domain-containing protein